MSRRNRLAVSQPLSKTSQDRSGQKFTKFFALSKIEETAENTLRVYGIVTAEQPDRDGEICDIDGTAPLYRARAEEMTKATSVEGMEKSIMPLRYMHQLDAVGRGITMDIDETTKTIRMGFEVVDPACILKVRKGVLPCFSQGGRYIKTWADPDNKKYTRYIADPGEVSLVDLGCLPGAVIESMKSQPIEMFKADGTKVKIKPVEKASDCQCTCTACNEDDNCAGCTMSECDCVGCTCPGHALEAEELKALRALIAKEQGGSDMQKQEESFRIALEKSLASHMAKGLWTVGRFAEVLESIKNLLWSIRYEEEFENDAETELPAVLEANLSAMLETFATYVKEEIAEESAALAAKGETSVMIKTEFMELLKVTGFAGHFKKSAAHAEKVAGAHSTAVEAIEKCMGKADDPMMKAMLTFHKGMAKAFGSHAEHLAKMADSCAEDGKKADEPEVLKAEGIADLVKAALTDALKPLSDEVALLKAKQIVDPGAAVEKPADKTVDMTKLSLVRRYDGDVRKANDADEDALNFGKAS